MDDNGRNRALEIVTWFACLVVSLILGVGLWVVRSIFPFLGLLAVGCLVVCMVCGLALIVEFTIRRFTRVSTHDVGQFGTMTHNLLGSARVHSPYHEKQIAEPKVKVTLAVPTVAELLKEGSLGTADLLLGYRLDGSPKWGSWSNINTFCIAGKSRSGKTITMFFIILQALLNNAIVWVCDPHGAGRKQSALKKLLEPLAPWVRFACTPDEIENMADEFIDAMQLRIDGGTDDFTPHLFVCDEFNGIAEEIPRLYEVVNKCAREWAGVYGYAAIAGHEWTASGKGKGLLVAMRRNLHAKFVHRLDEGYAKFLLNSGKHAKLTEKLRTGCNYFQDVEGEIDELKTPLGTVQDAVTVAELLTRLVGGPELPRQIVEPDSYYQSRLTAPTPRQGGSAGAGKPRYEQIAQYTSAPRQESRPAHTWEHSAARGQVEPETDSFAPETNAFGQAPAQVETTSFSHEMEELRLNTRNETPAFDLTTRAGRKQEIARLRGLQFKQTEIIQHIWHIKPGESQAYKNALAEYKQALQELLVQG